MQKIPLSLARPGMVLAREVRKDDDDVSPPICGRGISLSEALISCLEKMGIQTITVEGKPVSMEGDKSSDEMLAILDRRFSKVMDDPFNGRIERNLQRTYIENYRLTRCRTNGLK